MRKELQESEHWGKEEGIGEDVRGGRAREVGWVFGRVRNDWRRERSGRRGE